MSENSQSELDKKLRKIANDLCSLSVDEDYAVIAIKETFVEAHWCWKDIEYADQIEHMMTGQEWYDRFEIELTKRIVTFIPGAKPDSIVMQAARKAAGIEK